jgi:signal transduction histidine kinase
MIWSRMRQYLAPPPEREEAFRREIQRLSQSGLKTLGALELGGPILTFLVLFLLQPEAALRGGHMPQLAPLALVGVVTSAVARLERTRRHARVVALVSALAAACVLIWASAVAEPINKFSQYIPTGVTILMLTMVAALPLRPMHALALGLGIEAVYACAEMAIAAGPYATAAISPPHHTFILILTLLSTGVAAVLYAQRRSDFFSHQEALRATEALTGAQLRAELAENAAAIGKLAAALTHEINSPLGALRSAVDTLVVVAGRQASAPPEKQAALVAMQAELRQSIQSSAVRIQRVVERLQRFVGLGEAEIKTANLNDLLCDVAVLMEEKIRAAGVVVQFDLAPLPDLSCRPQLLTAVFSSLLSNAIDAVDGDGRIVVSTQMAESLVRVTIQDNGRGMTAGEVEHIFDPGFRVDGKRVYSGNWSLFNTRQILYEHGGEIQIESTEGRGTTVSVTIPA